MRVSKLYICAALVGLGVVTTMATADFPRPIRDALNPKKPTNPAPSPNLLPTSTPPSQPTTTSGNPNQAMANAIAKSLRDSGVAKGADVQVMVQGGAVTLSGKILGEQQRSQIVDVVLKHQGVTKLVDTMMPPLPANVQPTPSNPPTTTPRLNPPPTPTIPQTLPKSNPNPTPPSNIKPVSGLDQPAELPKLSPPMNGNNGPPMNPMANPMPIGPVGPTGPVYPGPMMGGYPAMGGGVVQMDPVPLAGPGGFNYDQTGPHLPPYAWPTYAPYNNYSRVAYPQAYPYNAFPFIGPFYPYPKVPPSWRTVQLRWEDGYWWYGRVSTPHDYWRVRFW